jgi:hypothetical protein
MYINSRAYLQRCQVGLDLKNLIDLGGSARFARHMERSKDYQEGQGARCKPAWVSSSFSRRRTGRPLAGGVGVLWWLKARVAGAGVGGDRGKLGDVLTSGGEGQQGGPRRTSAAVDGCCTRGGASVAGSRRKTVQQVRLDTRKPPVASVCCGRRRLRRIGGGALAGGPAMANSGAQGQGTAWGSCG